MNCIYCLYPLYFRERTSKVDGVMHHVNLFPMHLLPQCGRNTSLHWKKVSDHLKMAFDLKMLFGSLVMSVLLVATSAIGIQKYNEDNQTNINKNFLIFTLVFGIVGILLAFVGGGLRLKA